MESTTKSSYLFQKIRGHLSNKIPVNYLYFLGLFLLLFFASLCNILMIKQGGLRTKAFFLFYDLGELLLEFLGIVLVSILGKRWLKRGLYLLYIGGLFVFLLLQIIEIPLVQLMDLSIGEALHVAFGADFNNFVEFLRLSDVGLWAWYGVFILLALCPALGIYIYRLLEKLSARRMYALSCRTYFTAAFVIPLALMAIDGYVSPRLDYSKYSAYKKSLPWKGTLFKVPLPTLPVSHPLKPPVDPEEFLDKMVATAHPITKRPNIYLFVVESLRRDYLTDETAPHLMAFSKQYVTPKLALSGANHTIVSWFSIFHSMYPFYWSYANNSYFKEGSLPLHMLKQWGYQVHVYSSAQLRYYHFDEVMLGEKLHLADSFSLFPHQGMVTASDSDQKMMQTFEKDLDQHSKEGHIYVFFLDSTHFNYSWPKDFSEKFTPSEEITWKHRLSGQEKALNVLKNRYKNSIAFVDDLFGKTIDSLRKRSLYEESIVVFCGDHGEEFKEEGKLFHASHLSLMQVEIPLFYKLGNLQKQFALSSHIDIFPTIIDYLDPGNSLLSYFDGNSVLKPQTPSFGVVARFNSSSHPYEFLVHQGSHATLLRFGKKDDIFSAKQLKLLREYDFQEERSLRKEELVIERQKAINVLFSER